MAAVDTGSLDTPGPHARRSADVDLPRSGQKPPILMIGRDPTLMTYKAAVLATANLSVATASPAEAESLLVHDANYKLVILSHTLEPNEALHIQQEFRARQPGTRLLLMLGPGGSPLNYGLFDAALRGLDGPAALIGKVRELLHTESAPACPESHANFNQ